MPVRKPNRLKDYDYGSNGAYFITFCVKDGHGILGKLVVGRDTLDAPHVELSEYGTNVCNAIDFINQNHDGIEIVKYVVMPNHVHLIIIVNNFDGGASRMPRPTNAEIPKIISSIKRFTNKQAGFNM